VYALPVHTAGLKRIVNLCSFQKTKYMLSFPMPQARMHTQHAPFFMRNTECTDFACCDTACRDTTHCVL